MLDSQPIHLARLLASAFQSLRRRQREVAPDNFGNRLEVNAMYYQQKESDKEHRNIAVHWQT